jgi:uncharacterized membrane protein YbhN (UPF0104 family)
MRIIVILSVGLLISVAYSAFTVDSSALNAFSQFPLLCILALAGMVILPWLADTLRVQVWLRFLGKRERFTEVLQMTLATEMASAVSPAAIGGSGAKLGWMVSRGIAPGVASSIMALNAFEDIVFFILALPLALLLSPATGNGVTLDKFFGLLQQYDLTGGRTLGFFLLGIIGLAFAGRLAWIFLPPAYKSRVAGGKKKLAQQAGVAKQTFRVMIAQGKWRLVVTVGLSGLHWLCRFSMLTVLLVGLQNYVDPFNLFASQWLVFMLVKLVPSPGGAGGAELAFLFFYRASLPENLLGLLVGAWRVLTFTLPVGLATLLFLALVRREKLIGFKSFRLNKAAEAA